MVTINSRRLIEDLATLRSFGAEGHGVVRTTFSPVDMEARGWLMARMEDAGLDAVVDGVGTVFGRAAGCDRAVLIGSHSDTQPRGGWLDGAMGVIYAVEVARALRESEALHGLGVDVASWSDEEGSYFGFLGSRSFCDQLDDRAIAEARNVEGELLVDALARTGLAGRPRVTWDAGRHLGYFEAHIEQGPYLEAQGRRIGVVTGIVGMRDYHIVLTGQQNHAGTTPMDMRRDAGGALIDLAYEIRRTLRQMAGPRTVWNIGRVVFDPGAGSIVPGKAEMDLQIRDLDEGRLDDLEAVAHSLVDGVDRNGIVTASMARRSDTVHAVEMDDRLQSYLANAAERHAPGLWIRMPSAAGHDAQVLATRLPCAMLFVPSIAGISHDFAEDTAEEDIVLGCQVLADAVASLLADAAG